MRVIVCGGRTYHLTSADYAWLETLNITHVRQGGASGADGDARDWADTYGIPCQTYVADWDRHGKAAGPIRNTEMLGDLLFDAECHEPIAVIAFPGGRGTADMVAQARRAGIRILERAQEAA